jgi:hypothetical protein
MEELFVENFFKLHQHKNPNSGNFDDHFHHQKINTPSPQQTFELSVSQNNDQKIDRKNNDALLDMSICLDRLQKEIEGQYVDFADYRFIFNKIRASFKQNNIDGVIELLDDLEELLDLGMPSLIVKKNLTTC